MTTEHTEQTRIRLGEGEHPQVGPISVLVQLAGQFQADIRLETRWGGFADAKSVMQVYLFCQNYGNEATVRAQGPDAARAMEAIRRNAKNIQHGVLLASIRLKESLHHTDRESHRP